MSLMLILRKPEPIDLPPLYNLAEDMSPRFLDDYHELTVEYVTGILSDPHTLVIDDNGYACGAVWFDKITDDLHASIHFLIRPQYLKQFLRQQMPKEIITKSFESLGVARLYAFTADSEKGTYKLLKRLGFYSHLPWRSHTKQNGVKRDITFHELKKSKWSKSLC